MKIPNNVLLFIGIFILIAVGAIVYFLSRKNYIKIPGNGSDIPTGWDATITATKLRDTMEGWGTDERTFFATMDALSTGQIALVYNRYIELFNTTIIKDIKGDFSGGELARALSYFRNIPGIGLERMVSDSFNRLQRSVVSNA